MMSKTKNFNNPEWIIERNNHNRKYSSKEYELFTLDDDMEHIKIQKFKFPIFIQTPNENYHPPRQLPSQEEYNKIIKDIYPIGTKVLSYFNEHIGSLIYDGVYLVMAGGSAARPLYPNKNNKKDASDGDIDFFIIDPYVFKKERNSSLIIYSCVQRVYDKIKQFPEVKRIESEIKKGLLNLNVTFKNDETFKYQIILKVYSSISCLIHSFDIGSSCIAFDGNNTYMTEMGAYSQVNTINLVIPEYCSPTFEIRLKKYFYRGYILGLIHSKDFPELYGNDTLSKFPRPIECKLPRMNLCITQKLDVNICLGLIIDIKNEIKNSPYDRTGFIPSQEIFEINRLINFVGSTYFESFDISKDEIQKCFQFLYHVSKKQDILSFTTIYDKQGNSTENFLTKMKPDITLEDIISEENLIFIMDFILNLEFIESKFVLSKYLGMTRDQVSLLEKRYYSLLNDYPDYKINIKPTLKPFYDAILKKYQAFKFKKIDFYNTFPDENVYEDYHKTPMSNFEWYGVFYQMDSKCCLCNTATTNDKDIVVFKCGHKFHAEKNVYCNGIISNIIETKNDTCPKC